MSMTRILFASDFHGSDTCFRKFISGASRYQAYALIAGGDVTGKALVPIVHQGNGRYRAFLFERKFEHVHIHESPGYSRIGRTLSINAGSEYSAGILSAAIINLERTKIKGYILVSG